MDLESNWGRGYISKFNALKNDNAELKTLAAVGGWNEGSLGFSEVNTQKITINLKARMFLLHNYEQ